MRFIDEAKIRVSGGHGGPGCVSFRRETFAPRGGPDGGNGGAGGNVIFEASDQLGTLQDFRFKRSYQAPNGMHGSGSNKTGKDGQNILIRVPIGTVFRDTETHEVLADLTENGQQWVACQGGRGGKGNAHFTSSTFQAPKFAQPGEEGESREVTLELKLIADVGIIGYPNAGKSTLISKISAARPKIADYPFTTLTPNLGVVAFPNYSTFVVADIPGLVEGAHLGKGLGHRFLKHIERTKMFIHLLDGTQLLEDATTTLESDQTPDDTIQRAVSGAAQRYANIRNELGQFNPDLLHKPELVAVNKLDILESDPHLLEQLKKGLREEIAKIRGTYPLPQEPWLISAFTGAGVESFIQVVYQELQSFQKMSGASEEGTPLPDDENLRK